MPAAAWAALGLIVSFWATVIAPKPAPAVCPQLVAYTLPQEQAIAASLQKLEPTDPLVGFTTDSLALRKAAKACSGK